MLEYRLLVAKCQHGSKDALCRIYQKYKNDLLSLAIAFLNDKGAAEDVLHDVFISFVQGLKDFELNGSLKGYLATCIANRARNWNKAKYQQQVNLEQAAEMNSGSNQPYESIACNEQLLRLSTAMAKLPFDQREVILLHTKGRLRLRAIADLQDVSVNTIKSRYRYGLEKLRKILKEVEK